MSEKIFNIGMLGIISLSIYKEALDNFEIDGNLLDNVDLFQDAEEALNAFTTKKYDLILIEGIAFSKEPKNPELAKIINEELNKKGQTVLSKGNSYVYREDLSKVSPYIIKKIREEGCINQETYIMGLAILDTCNCYPYLGKTILDAGADEFFIPFIAEKKGETGKDYSKRLTNYFFTKIELTLKKPKSLQNYKLKLKDYIAQKLMGLR